MKSKAGKLFSILLGVGLFVGVIVSLLYSYYSSRVRIPDNITVTFDDVEEPSEILSENEEVYVGDESIDNSVEEIDTSDVRVYNNKSTEFNIKGDSDESSDLDTEQDASKSEVSDGTDEGLGDEALVTNLDEETFSSYCYYCVIGFAIIDDVVRDEVTTDFQLGYNAMMAEEPFKTLNGKRTYQSYKGDLTNGTFSVTFDDIGTYNFHVELVDDKIDKITFLDNSETTQESSSDSDISEDSEEN